MQLTPSKPPVRQAVAITIAMTFHLNQPLKVFMKALVDPMG